MKTRYIVLIIAAVLGFFAGTLIATSARADIPPPDFNRAIYISGPITSDGMGSVGKAMLGYGKSGNAPISIILNSPGGEVYAGLHFIDMMHSLQAKGITIRCYVQQVAPGLGELVGPKWMQVADSIPNLLEVPATVPNATGSDFSLRMQSGTRPHIIYILE